jgi:hypothetical protein
MERAYKKSSPESTNLGGFHLRFAKTNERSASSKSKVELNAFFWMKRTERIASTTQKTRGGGGAASETAMGTPKPVPKCKHTALHTALSASTNDGRWPRPGGKRRGGAHPPLFQPVNRSSLGGDVEGVADAAPATAAAAPSRLPTAR